METKLVVRAVLEEQHRKRHGSVSHDTWDWISGEEKSRYAEACWEKIKKAMEGWSGFSVASGYSSEGYHEKEMTGLLDGRKVVVTRGWGCSPQTGVRFSFPVIRERKEVK